MTLKVGDLSPNFEFVTSDGASKSLHDIQGRVVLFFYPKAFTPGCTSEACSIRDTLEDLQQHGVQEVIGISTDDQETQQRFAETYNLPYLLLSDKDGSISKSYGVFRKLLFLVQFSDRVTYVIGEDKRIEAVFLNGITGRKSKYGLKFHGREIIEKIG